METIEFKNYNLKINLKPFINIIGLSGSGKTHLLKELININKSDDIYIDEKSVKEYDIYFLKQNIAATLNDFNFKTNYVNEELYYYQQILEYDENTCYKNVQKFIKLFNLDEIIEAPLDNLTKYEQAFIKILSFLIYNPSILGIDGLFEYLTNEQKYKIMKYAKNNNITILNVTSNPEELLLGSDIIVLDNHKLLVYDETKNILSNEKLLDKINMSLPFIVEMSNNLNYYDLLNKKFFNLESLIGELWK